MVGPLHEMTVMSSECSTGREIVEGYVASGLPRLKRSRTQAQYTGDINFCESIFKIIEVFGQKMHAGLRRCPMSSVVRGHPETRASMALTRPDESAYTPCAAANDAPAQVAERQTR
ncbi:MAG: hypothetical protein QM753_09090 [Thermomicrobiales bacterium]